MLDVRMFWVLWLYNNHLYPNILIKNNIPDKQNLHYWNWPERRKKKSKLKSNRSRIPRDNADCWMWELVSPCFCSLLLFAFFPSETQPRPHHGQVFLNFFQETFIQYIIAFTNILHNTSHYWIYKYFTQCNHCILKQVFPCFPDLPSKKVPNTTNFGRERR